MGQASLAKMTSLGGKANSTGMHRYRKAKIDCLSLFMCPLLVQLKIGFFSSFSAAAVYSTNKQTRQALSSLQSLDVYAGMPHDQKSKLS